MAAAATAKAIKLTMATTTSTTSSSIHARSHWVRTTITRRVPIAATAASRAISSINGPGPGPGMGGKSKNGEQISGWRLINCASIGGAQDQGIWRGQKPFFSRSRANKQGGPVADMGSESNDDRDQNHNHNHRSPSPSTTANDLQQPLHPQSPPTTKLLTLPTILTLGRVAAVPILVTTFYMNSWWATTATTSIFVIAAITDWLDGYIARKMCLGTAFGAFLDPVADKLMVAATLVLLCTRPFEFAPFGEIPWLLPVPAIAIIGREITMSAVREWAASQNGKVLEAVAVNNLGKWKTASQMIALTILLASRDSSLIGSNILVPSGVALLYVSAGLAVWSLAVYMKKIWRILLKL